MIAVIWFHVSLQRFSQTIYLFSIWSKANMPLQNNYNFMPIVLELVLNLGHMLQDRQDLVRLLYIM